MFQNWVIITTSTFLDAAKKLSNAYNIPVWSSQDASRYDFGGVEGVIILESEGSPINTTIIPFLQQHNIEYKRIHSKSTDNTAALNSIMKYIDNTFLLRYPPVAPSEDPYLRLEKERQRAEWQKWVRDNSFKIKDLFRNWGMEITDSQVFELARGTNRTLIELYSNLVQFEPYREIYHQYYGKNPFEGEELAKLADKLLTSPYKVIGEIVKDIKEKQALYWTPPEGTGAVTTPALRPLLLEEPITAYKGYVVIARSDSDVDLEAANLLARAVGGRVMRVSPSGKLTEEQIQELGRAAGAFIVGGAKAISLDLEENLLKQGVLSQRFSGATAEETRKLVEEFVFSEARMQQLGKRATELITALKEGFATPQEFARWIEASEKVGVMGETWQELMEKELGIRMGFEEMQSALMGRAGYGVFEDLLRRAQALYKQRWARTGGVKI